MLAQTQFSTGLYLSYADQQVADLLMVGQRSLIRPLHSRIAQDAFLILCCLQEALRYTDDQITDLLMVRQLFFTKLGQLSHARTAALNALSQCTGQLHEIKLCTDRLQALVEETYHVYLQFGAACNLGVGCCFQWHSCNSVAAVLTHGVCS